MKRILVGLLVFCPFFQLFAQAGSEIYLFDISSKKDKVSISSPANITNHKGYDNQPSFHPKQPFIYYASFNDEGRSEIWCYDYNINKAKQITSTPEREYSPTVTPDGGHLSCIIQRDNNAQDLGKYSLDGTDPSVIVDNLIVGYHTWADNSHLALFVLGTPRKDSLTAGTPNTLHYLRLPTKRDTVIAEGIGRSLHKIPGGAAISFVHKISEKEWIIKRMETASMKVSSLAPTLPGREDLCWLPDGKVLMSDGTKLFFLVPGQSLQWKEVTLSTPLAALKGITRLAVSSNGKKLAVVVTED